MIISVLIFIGKYCMKLLNTIKIGLFACIVVMHNARAMELTDHQKRGLELFSYDHTEEKFMRELPLMTLNLVGYRYSRCSDEVKKDIDEKLAGIKDEFYLFFNWEPCAKTLFKNNEQVYQASLNVPIREMHKVFENHSWALKKGKEGVHFLRAIALNEHTKDVVKEQLFKSGAIFRHADAIKQADSYFKAKEDYKQDIVQICPVASRNVLEFLDLLNKKIKEINNDGSLVISKGAIVYNCCDTYTGKNFLNKFKNQGEVLVAYILCIAPIVTAWLSRHIELNYCQKMLTEDDIGDNLETILFNEGLSRAKMHSEEIKERIKHFQQDLSQYEQYLTYWINFENPRAIIEPYYSWSDYFKVNSPFWTTSFLICLPSIMQWIKGDLIIQHDNSTPIGWALAGGIGLQLLSCFRFDNFPLGFLGVFTGVSAGFLGLACIKSIYDMRRPQRVAGTLEDISEVLNQCRNGERALVE